MTTLQNKLADWFFIFCFILAGVGLGWLLCTLFLNPAAERTQEVTIDEREPTPTPPPEL